MSLSCYLYLLLVSSLCVGIIMSPINHVYDNSRLALLINKKWFKWQNVAVTIKCLTNSVLKQVRLHVSHIL